MVDVKAKLKVKKGGPGSGHHGHSGLEGVWGGSTPSGGGGGGGDYRTFNSDDEAHEYGKKHLAGGVSERLGGVGDAIIHYTKHGYNEVNGYLRGRYSEGEILKKSKRAVNAFDKLMDHEDSVVPEDITVMREFGYNFFDDKPVGTIFKDKGFVSTTMNPTPKRYPDAVRVLVPKGTRAAYIREFSQQYWENELLLDRGQNFEVVKNDSDGIIVKVTNAK